MVTLVDTPGALNFHLKAWRARGEKIGLVPTMGNLHAGHISLVRHLRDHVDRIILSIFVNPTQFGEGEDFSHYPRTLEADCAKLAQAGVDLAYVPTLESIYPPGFSTHISVGALGTLYEGVHRPGHFDGVATIVAKLLLQTQPDSAIFGEKDLQQLAVIRRMAKDLDLSCQILSAPIVRDQEGLALSSRNGYLSDTEMATARQLNKVLRWVAATIKQGGVAHTLCDTACSRLLQAGFNAVDYLALIDPATFQERDPANGGNHLIVAARLGHVRLLDNLAI